MGDTSGSVVTFENGEDSTTVITGFTITNGKAHLGGGIHCNNSSVVITDNYITFNIARGRWEGEYYYTGKGGGMRFPPKTGQLFKVVLN